VASRDGYFAPESVIRRVGNEPLVPLLGGGPAVLLQVAHPLVAAGIVHHSAYEEDLWKRFMRTMEALYLIVYGSRGRRTAQARSCRQSTPACTGGRRSHSVRFRPERSIRPPILS
jgi:uncharacterized protein (DUF2236 family)